MPLPICYVDSEERYRFTNKAYENWVGRSRLELRGAPIRDVLGESTYQMIRPNVAAVLRGREVSFVVRLWRADGELHDVHATYVPHFSAASGVKGFAAAVIDVTDLRRTNRLFPVVV